MSKPTNVFIIEQEPLITHSIKDALHTISKSKTGMSFNTKSVRSFEFAYSEIKKSRHLSLVFLNIDMYSTYHEKSKFIIEMVSTLKRNSPKAQLLTLTSIRDNYMIFDLIRTLNPESILLKTDITFKDLIKAIENVINDIPFYSKTILQLLRSRMSCDINLDKTDRLILYHLSKGAKTKDLSKFVFLSRSGIESRKRNLKTLFNAERQSDQFLLEQARLKGFI
ncbi:hypothetical protein [uncultured Psychroserpens sp.]|uniref:hypothetical protein n=1 Tax=uncultured Psychroserpens sp. TaxID=255436 RepID=UPI002633FA59|nr:hypothetical protein [uncultured Psychroserpens sp.]